MKTVVSRPLQKGCGGVQWLGQKFGIDRIKFNPHCEPAVVLMSAILHPEVKVGELAGVLGQDGHSEFQARQGYSETLSQPN